MLNHPCNYYARLGKILVLVHEALSSLLVCEKQVGRRVAPNCGSGVICSLSGELQGGRHTSSQLGSDGYGTFKTALRRFMEERDWMQFHNPKDLAIAISLEASELLEHFLWKNGEEIGSRVRTHGEKIREEAADIGIYLMELCHVLGVDLVEEMFAKLEKAALKYPVDRAKGSSQKYSELNE